MARRGLDRLDGRMLCMLRERPRAGLLEIARQLGVARGTLQARLDRLTESGVVTGYGPDVDVAALGHAVQAFTTFEVDQPAREAIAARLRAVPQILEAHVVTGSGDIWCRIAGTSNQHVQRVIDHVLEVPGVRRSATVIALSPVIPYRVQPLVDAVAGTAPGAGGSGGLGGPAADGV
ncbi:Lrp/AsnC family transcriptional regulator [Streptomyces sp. NBC_00525]|uniref:Lrp/AsnC family transcriptional regulator n=1 Tax=Streptomyces sp. NBC_00525 TaxID=2903660 RepID=UPI002E7FFF56|nr:Lrp/AsnC family transcriptional regulator [Streptomyces sp. NBC_00525]WUC98105.1 Lrp/AsnC family transcriptional regulator [Streptomyces sp. NBC_00525]